MRSSLPTTFATSLQTFFFYILFLIKDLGIQSIQEFLQHLSLYLLFYRPSVVGGNILRSSLYCLASCPTV